MLRVETADMGVPKSCGLWYCAADDGDMRAFRGTLGTLVEICCREYGDSRPFSLADSREFSYDEMELCGFHNDDRRDFSPVCCCVGLCTSSMTSWTDLASSPPGQKRGDMAWVWH